MIKIVLVGWFFISLGDKDVIDGKTTYNYLLEDKARNVHVGLTTKEPLKYPIGSWGKFKMNAECDEVKTSSVHGNSARWVNSTFCSADNHKILPCRRGMIVGSITYCE